MEHASFETKKDYILRQIKKKILDGEFQPGERLKVRPLAQEFGTSEIPVREAIHQLVSTGLVTMTPHVGAVASPISTEDLREIFQIRSALERVATELGAAKLTEEDLTHMFRIQKELEDAVEAGVEPETLNRINREFHMVVYARSGNRRLVSMIEELWNHAGRYPAPLTGRNEPTYQSIKEHRQILEALKARDIEQAAELTEQHKNRSMKWVMEQVGARERGLVTP